MIGAFAIGRSRNVFETDKQIADALGTVAFRDAADHGGRDQCRYDKMVGGQLTRCLTFLQHKVRQ